jgi:hypothetical protein
MKFDPVKESDVLNCRSWGNSAGRFPLTAVPTRQRSLIYTRAAASNGELREWSDSAQGALANCSPQAVDCMKKRKRERVTAGNGPEFPSLALTVGNKLSGF